MTNGNDAAYPETRRNADRYYSAEGGLSKREYFAAMAMKAAFNGSYGVGKDEAAEVAEIAVTLADALIDALNKEPK